MNIQYLTILLTLAITCHMYAVQSPPSIAATNVNVPGQATNVPDEYQLAYIEEIARLRNQISDLDSKLKDASPKETLVINEQIRNLTIEEKEKNLRYLKSRLEQSQKILDQGELSLGGTEKEYQEQRISSQQNNIAQLQAELNELKNKQ